MNDYEGSRKVFSLPSKIAVGICSNFGIIKVMITQGEES